MSWEVLDALEGWTAQVALSDWHFDISTPVELGASAVVRMSSLLDTGEEEPSHLLQNRNVANGSNEVVGRCSRRTLIRGNTDEEVLYVARFNKSSIRPISLSRRSHTTSVTASLYGAQLPASL